jgi:putative heme-binding domain-containing protein
MTRLLTAALCLLALAGGLVALLFPAAEAEGAGKLLLNKKDTIVVIGNTLAERLQHDGWLDTLLHSRFPEHDLTVRHLGYSGDEVKLRLRSAHFGTPDQWLFGNAPPPRPVPGADPNRFELTHTRPDVLFAFFGYGESFAGKEGLPAFKKDLASWVKDTLSKKYNGKSAPRLVLFSPIAHEDHRSPHLPDGQANNERLALYTEAMKEVAQAEKCHFVDLFTPTKALYAKSKSRLTINGIHLNEDGNREVARIITDALFGPKEVLPPAQYDTLRAAVKDRNWHWFHRYRVTDGYSTYGERAFLTFAPEKQSNYIVAQRELRILDIMTRNRDEAIWRVAKGEPASVKDDNLPDHIPVKTNKPGPGPQGSHVFLDGEEAIKKMRVHKDLKVNLFADEKMFPDLVNAVQMQFDPKGRLWVAAWPTYPHWKPGEKMNDKILILEDTDGDGKADKCTVWADGLHCPTGFELYDGGALVAQCPELWLLKDATGKGKADLRQRVVHGLDSADTHHASNSFVMGPGGDFFFQEGTFHHSQVETPYGPTERLANAGVFRYHARTQRFEVYVTFGFANPHGHVFDRWGRDIVVDGTGAQPYDAALFSGRLEFPHKHKAPPTVWSPPSRPCPGMEVLSSKHFPDDWQGNVLVANVIGFQGIFQIKLRDDGASMKGQRVDDILSSTDPNFRPSDVKVGPDGAVYFCEWHNPIIGHMQHNLRDPSRGRSHGRVYRITHKDRPLSKSPAIAGEPVEKLLDLLKQPEDRVRYRTRIELTGRPTKEVLAAASKWVAALDEKDAQHEHHLLEALWLHQSHDTLNAELLERVLKSKEPLARAAATRVLCAWRDKVKDPIGHLLKLAADPAPRVRLEAVRAASFFKQPEALEVLLVAQEKPTDQYLDLVRGESLRALQPYVTQAINGGRKIAFRTAAGARYFLRTVSNEDLMRMERTPGVLAELLFRPGIRDEARREALAGLAKQERKPEVDVLVSALTRQDENEATAEPSVAFDLARLLGSRPADELTRSRAGLEKLAASAGKPLTRQLGYVALIAADSSPEKAWALASRSVQGLADLADAVPLVRDPAAREALYPKLASLLERLPEGLSAPEDKRLMARVVRIELPGKLRTLTLAEVEVYSNGVNVARKGKATQHSTAHGGDASRAIDGNTSGSFVDGGQTHTLEGVTNPWWQVDLGKEHPIERIVIYNRTDGNLGDRLKSYSVIIRDGSGNVVHEAKKLPTPSGGKAELRVGTLSPIHLVRRAAMKALPSVRGREGDTVKALLKHLDDEGSRHAAVQALLRVPARLWPEGSAKPALDSLLAFIRKTPEKERTADEPLDALALCDALAGALPADEGRKLRRELGELSVRVLRLGTLVERMQFDRERLVVQAGKPAEVIFENTDTMPHNFVIVEPGSLEEVGNLAEKTAQDPKSPERQYVPPSEKVLVKSRLLQPREVQKLSFTAPKKPGVYPYVCTYPGHWRRMHGALYVVESLEEYEAGPEAYLAKHPLKVEDELLKYNRPRKEWKLEELASDVAKLEGRSFAAGKSLFKVAACVSCHKFGGEGAEFGPDLTKFDPKWKNEDVLKHILDPSLKIDDKYRTYTFRLSSGMVKTGMILAEKDGYVEVIENPLASSKPFRIKKDDIEAREASKVSIMPKGLLDKLTRDEVLDLMAYVLSGANPRHRAFTGGHGH